MKSKQRLDDAVLNFSRCTYLKKIPELFIPVNLVDFMAQIGTLA